MTPEFLLPALIACMLPGLAMACALAVPCRLRLAMERAA